MQIYWSTALTVLEQKESTMTTALRSVALIIFVTTGLFAPPLSAQTIYGNFTCDNSYAVWIGTPAEVVTLIRQETNTTASDIFHGETFSFEYTPQCQIYIAAWSDDRVLQGLIGTFSGGVTLKTGDPQIEVLATGIDFDNNQFPTAAQINAALLSTGTITPALPTGGTFVSTAVGSRNLDSSPWGWSVDPVLEMHSEALWIWHESGDCPGPESPFTPGCNHDEFLIFRIPCDELVPIEPDVRTQGFWKRQCKGPHPSGEHDNLPDYVDRVNSNETFVKVVDVDGLCDRLNPIPKKDKCKQAEAQFMAASLNVASRGVGGSNCLDDPDLKATTVGEALSFIDGLLSNPAGSQKEAIRGRDIDDCVLAQAIADRINNSKTLVDCAP
jgi:hypothetical protein